MFQKDYKKIIEEKNKQRKMEEQLNKTRVNIIKTIKDRKRVEMEFLAAIKRQMGYWKNQMDNTDPENDKERYQQLKGNIEREKVHIKQIEDELDRINDEIKTMQKR
ncbi:MAG: hypothetical protein ACXVHP_02720 [Methanobacterium sp.]